ncbi:MAG: hypothetical protein Q4F95_07975 [Oscillospiraceae bacterium]|nr:hypothetical protein [Oscillospiraceae bacterium]
MKNDLNENSKVSFLSNIKINNKILFVCIFAFLPSVILLLSISVFVNQIETDRRNETISSMSNVSEQYVNTSIENIVAIAKSVYTNNTLYNFLDTRYESTVDYFDAFHKLTENNSLIIAENSNINNFTIYSDNDTILNGGNICKLSEVKDEEWYNNFIKLNKNMILYCDKDASSLSLIRKLDYFKVNSGDCFLKIDFNSNNLQTNFENLKFDGTIYVTSGDTVLYSTQKNASEQTLPDFSDYELFGKNYYTVEIQYYIKVNKGSIFTVLDMYKLYSVPVFILFAACMIFIFKLIRNISYRVNEIVLSYSKHQNFDMLRHSNYGNDEIGHLLNYCLDVSSRLKHNMRESDKLNTQICDYRNKNNNLLTELLSYEAKKNYLYYFNPEVMNNSNLNRSFICLDEEIENILKYKEEFKKKFNKELMINISNNVSESKKIYIPIYSMLSITDELVKRALNEDKTPDFKITFSDNKNKFVITIAADETYFSPGRLLKLRAIFENDSGYEDWKYVRDSKYNPYNRLKHFYGSSINLEVSSSSNSTIELTIDKTTMQLIENPKS